jgi:hypothetical protein
VTKIFFAGLASALFALTEVSLAQVKPSPGSDPTSLGASLTGQAKDAYDAARLLFANQDFGAALAEFGRAYAADPDPRLLFDMAVCEKSLHRYVATTKLLERYVAQTDPRISAESRATAEGALSALAKLIGTARITVSEPGATVLVDHDRVGQTPLAPVPVDIGTHRIVVEKPGFAPTERQFEVSGQEETSVNVQLTPLPFGAELIFAAEANSTISVDGRMVTHERFDGRLPAGLHEVVVTAPDRKTFRAKIELHEGETLVRNITLEAEPRASVWPWIAGGAALAVGVGVGTYVLLRSPESGATAPHVDQGYTQFRGSWSR